jgi:hypothetical protein
MVFEGAVNERVASEMFGKLSYVTFNHGVAGSSPAGLTNKTVSGPETWVTGRT